MHCSGCGKNIPFGGQVCPYCKRDKSSDQTATVAGVMAMMVGGFFGNLIAGFVGMIVGAFSLGIVAAIVSQLGKGNTAKKPPRARIDPVPPIPAPKLKPPQPLPVSATIEDRLRRLDSLKSQGLITEEEYGVQRAAIIAAI
ncbi:SHOCT domain-containing protein [Sphingomonas adhaesiva]|uniref:SHOCT domain-containing protein n=1 Tax=Sphingomonas adhaesiva TaxID=28212 RepID=UPI002FF6D7FF